MRYVHKFAIFLSISLFSSLLTYLLLPSLPQAEPQPTPQSPFALGIPVERFPILPRFEVPRRYGFFIGDQIPLKLLIETTGDVIVNLAKLPQKGQQHGPFEIRDMQITRQATSRLGTHYRVAYVLQYFGPTPISAVFKGVEILYADSSERQTSSQPYIYKRLVTQPVSIDISRLTPFRLADSRAYKGATDAQHTLMIWLGSVFTLCCLIASSVFGITSFNQKRHSRQTADIQQQGPQAEHLQAPLFVVSRPSGTTHQQSNGKQNQSGEPVTASQQRQKVKTP